MDWLNTQALFAAGESIDIKSPEAAFDCEAFIHSTLKHLSENLEKRIYTKKVKRGKDNSKSSTFREAGNKIFLSNDNHKSLEKALELYTKSIAYAIPSSKELALSFANRSAVLMKFNRLKECLEDIERALQLNYPDKLKPKLYYRKAECHSKLAAEVYTECKFWTSKLPLNDHTRKSMEDKLKDQPSIGENKRIIDEECHLPEVQTPSDKYPYVCEAVEVQCSEWFGRHVVATRDIDIGQVLVVERPYSKFLSFENLYTHCSFCLKSLWTGVACDHCVNAAYCSETCKIKAWTKYHRLECSLLDLLLQYDCTRSEAFSARLLLQASIEAGGLQELKKRINNLKHYTNADELHLKYEWYHNSSLEGIFSLVTNADKTSPSELREKALCALRTVFILATSTVFFGTQYNCLDAELITLMLDNADVKFVGGLLVELALIILNNFHSFTEDDFGAPRERGSAAMPFLSLINHSCFPNINRQSKRNHVVVRATVPIKKSEQIFDNYGEHCAITAKAARQENLLKNYHFTCTCICCRDDWPLYTALDSYEKTMKLCITQQELKEALSEFSALYAAVARRDLTDKEKLLKKLYKMLKIVYDGVNLPCKNVNDIVETINQIYLNTGNVSKLQMIAFTLQ